MKLQLTGKPKAGGTQHSAHDIGGDEIYSLIVAISVQLGEIKGLQNS